MSYTVFALKWRPKTFDEVIGQSHIVLTLKQAIQKNRVAHAYLFAGPRGVGKTSMARILAKTLNCKQGPTITPCGACASCLEIAQGRSLDVIEIDGASNRGIDEIRVLRENVKFSPLGGKYKIYIIDEVHMLTPEAFNALLKTLEEPPEFVTFIFATTQPNKVISTILSRCQRFDFRRIPAMEIASQLERIAHEETMKVDKEVLFAIAKSSDGSLRDAESILDQLFSFSKEKISLKDVVSVLGLIEQDALFAIIDKIIQKDVKTVLKLVNGLIDNGKDMNVFLPSLIEHFRNLMIAKVTKADAKLIDLPQEVCERLFSQSEAFSLEEIFSAFTTLVNTQEMSKRLDSLRIPLEVTLIRLAYEKKGHAHNVQEHNSSKEELKKELEKSSAPLIKAHPAKNDHVEPPLLISFEDIKNAWANIISRLSSCKMSAATYLSEGEPLKLEGNVLTVSFPKNYSLHKESLEAKENRSMIEKVIADLLSAAVRVHFVLSEALQHKEDSREHPLIKSALEMFGGRVIKEG